MNAHRYFVRFFTVMLSVTLSSGSFFLAGCADSIWWGGESNLSSTETGVAAGAAIGAGVGAFIGSTAGGAGEGLVIGALAGGVTGGLVGREIDLEEGVKAERTETSRQSNEMIREQRKEQNRIRENTSDVARSSFEDSGAAPNNAQRNQNRAQLGRAADFESVNYRERGINRGGSVRYGKKTYLNPPSRPNSAARPYNASESYSRETVSARNAVNFEAGPRFQDRHSVANAQRARTSPPVASRETGETSTPSHLAALPPVATEPVSTLTPGAELSANRLPELPLAKDAVTTPPKVAEVATAALQPSTEQCVDAQEEALRAQTASSDADKLFYLTRAIRLCPQNSDYHTQVGKVYVKIGRQQDAEFEFRQALDLDENNAEAAELLGKKNIAAVHSKDAPSETAALDTAPGEEIPEGEF